MITRTLVNNLHNLQRTYQTFVPRNSVRVLPKHWSLVLICNGDTKGLRRRRLAVGRRDCYHIRCCG